MSRRIEVSDHAALRWLERVEGVNVRALKRRIGKAVMRGAAAGASAVRLDGVEFCIQYGDDRQGQPVAVVATTHSPHARPHLAVPRQARDEDPRQARDEDPRQARDEARGDAGEIA